MLTVDIKRAAVCLNCGRRYIAAKVEETFRFTADGPFIACACGVATYIRKEAIKESGIDADLSRFRRNDGSSGNRNGSVGTWL